MLFFDYTVKFNLSKQLRLMTKKTFYYYLLPALIVFNGVYLLGTVHSNQNLLATTHAHISQRVALDMDHISDVLPLHWDEGQQQVNYLAQLNNYLVDNHRGVLVTAIYPFEPNNLSPIQSSILLEGINNKMWVVVQPLTKSPLFYLSIWPNIFAFIISLGFINYDKRQQTKLKSNTQINVSPCRMQINLFNKSLMNPLTNKEVALANKPLCFYAALTDYCIANPNAKLNPNKELPEEFNRLCKKYFARLIELGHTIRKRPNFENNLEKTLSEIRAALDELYGEDLEAKEAVYPKKAIGEGSRSKAHNFALIDLRPELVEIFGS